MTRILTVSRFRRQAAVQLILDPKDETANRSSQQIKRDKAKTKRARRARAKQRRKS